MRENVWVVLPYPQERHLEELRILPPGVVPQTIDGHVQLWTTPS